MSVGALKDIKQWFRTKKFGGGLKEIELFLFVFNFLVGQRACWRQMWVTTVSLVSSTVNDEADSLVILGW